MSYDELEQEESWIPIQEFPNYSVSDLGRIRNTKTGKIVLPSFTKQGALKVSLVNQSGRKTRSVKVLVAEAFVFGKSDEFNTPIHLDMNQKNVCAYNLLWRPRWFAWLYTNQENEPQEDRDSRYAKGPIKDIDTGQLYDDIYHVSSTYGLIWWHVYISLHSDKSVFPTNQRFTYL